MRALLKDLKPHLKEVILAPAFKLLEAVFELFVPLVMKYIMDEAIPRSDSGLVYRALLVLLLLALTGFLSAIVAQYFSARAATGYASTLRRKLFSRIQTFSFSGLDEAGASTLITRMTSDVNQIQNGLNLTLRLFMRSPFIVFGAAIMAFTVDPSRAFVFAVVIPLLLVIVFAILFTTMPLYRRVQQNMDAVTQTTRENLSGVRVMRAFLLEEEENEKFRKQNEALRKLQLFVGRISAVLNPVTYVVINFAVLLILFLSGKMGSREGDTVALVNYMSQILIELVKLANLLIQMTLRRVSEVLRARPDDEPETLAEPPKPKESVEEARAESTVPKVEFRNVSLKYGESSGEALKNVSFTVREGETVGIIGGTGSGKTTLVSALAGYYPATEGSVVIDGRPVSDYTSNELRSKIGTVLQKATLFSGTIRSNLLMGDRNADDETMREALRDAEALSFTEEKDGGLDAAVEQEGRNYSGGQRQRLSIARALVKDPDILILDDSSSALDYATDRALRESIRKRSQKRTVFIISARTASVMSADRILVLDNGSLVGNGTHEELLKSSSVYREIYESQFQ